MMASVIGERVVHFELIEDGDHEYFCKNNNAWFMNLLFDQLQIEESNMVDSSTTS